MRFKAECDFQVGTIIVYIKHTHVYPLMYWQFMQSSSQVIVYIIYIQELKKQKKSLHEETMNDWLKEFRLII